MKNEKQKMKNEKRKMKNEKRKTKNEKRKMKNEKREMKQKNEKRKMKNKQRKKSLPPPMLKKVKTHPIQFSKVPITTQPKYCQSIKLERGPAPASLIIFSC